MNKKEISEIRKQFSMENCNITRITSCYVTGEKEILMTKTQAFLSLAEEEAFKYFDIFRKCLSGKLGKNLFNVACRSDDSQVSFTNHMRVTRLQDTEVTYEFIQNVISNYDCNENYLIILIHGAYDVPGRTRNEEEMFDASEEVYEYLMCTICPVALSKPGLSYNYEECCVRDCTRDWVVGDPVNAVLYPAFHDRSTDLNGCLYYTKKAEIKQDALLFQIVGTECPVTGKEENQWFVSTLEEISTKDQSLDSAVKLHNIIMEMEEENSEKGSELTIDQQELEKILENCGYSNESLIKFADSYEECIGRDKKIALQNLTDTQNAVLECGDFTVKMDADRVDLVETKRIDGRLYLAIPLQTNQVSLNQIPISLDSLMHS